MERQASLNDDRERAVDFLRQVRAHCGGTSVLDPPEAQDTAEMLAAFRKVHGARADALFGDRSDGEILDLLSKRRLNGRTLDDDPWSQVIASIIERIEENLEGDQAFFQRILFGSLPTGHVNGLAALVPQTDYFLILIDDGLFGFANLTCKAIANALPIMPPDDDGKANVSTDVDLVREQLRKKPEIKNRMLDFLHAYVVGGHPHLAKPYLVDKTPQAIAALLLEGLETFVIAHEYGHCIAGHLAADQSRRQALQSSGEIYDVISTSWQQEHEADFIGAMLTIQVMNKRGFDLALSYCGIEIFFRCVEIIEKTMSMLVFGEVRETPPSESHPPSLARCSVLREMLKRQFNEEQANAAIHLANCFEEIFASCWEICEPEFKLLHNKGARPAAQWSR
jgi:hypothetical protein